MAEKWKSSTLSNSCGIRIAFKAEVEGTLQYSFGNIENRKKKGKTQKIQRHKNADAIIEHCN